MMANEPFGTFCETIVFGSGLAGLACARRLALLNKSVCVLEKSKALGGHLLPFERSGLTFEVGIHYIADTGAGSHFADACDALQTEFSFVDLDSEFEQLHFDTGDIYRYSAPFPDFLKKLRNDFPNDKNTLDAYSDAVEAVMRLTPHIKFPITTAKLIKTCGSLGRDFSVIIALASSTCDGFFYKYNPSKKLYETLMVQHLLLGSSPKRMSAMIFFLVHAYYFQRPCFIKGGGREMIRQLMHPDVRYETETDAEIFRVSSGPNIPRGARFKVTWKEHVLYSKNIVWTPDPRGLRNALHSPLPKLLSWRLQKAINPHALVVGYFATRKPLSDYGLGNKNHWLLGTLDSHSVYESRDLISLVENGPIYLSTGSLRDPEAISEKKRINAQGIFQAMFLCPPDVALWGEGDATQYRVPESKGGFGIHYRKLKSDLLDKLILRIVKTFPTLDGELVWKELGTPLTHRRYLNSLSGNGYGFEPTVFDSLIGRPGYKSGLNGLYLSGAHIKPAHGIVTAMVNGVSLADKINN